MTQNEQGNLTALRTACVFIPLSLAALCMASTSLPQSIQNQFLLGIPMMLVIWFGVSVLICMLTVVMGRKIMRDLPDDTHDDSVARAITPVSSKTVGE